MEIYIIQEYRLSIFFKFTFSLAFLPCLRALTEVACSLIARARFSNCTSGA